jgi:hypothetical protein
MEIRAGMTVSGKRLIWDDPGVWADRGMGWLSGLPEY